ncbi:MAG: acyltransferase [Gemmatimonadaceae bacterium]|nr:acyltransferase [Gloeobacterales cyanobacterium ES-bin-141]
MKEQSNPVLTIPPILQPGHVHLDYLEGIRGLAALYVVLFHIVNQIRLQPAWSEVALPVIYATRVLLFGHFAVAVFITLSGYCLMLPVVRSRDGRLRGGFFDYLKRRSRRLLPPYYAALVLSLVLIALIATLEQFTDFVWWGLPHFPRQVTRDSLLSHLLLLHNLSPDWSHAINAPMWSLAIEWQIYFIFPLLLLPVWRRFGIVAAVILAFCIGFGPHFLLDGYLDWASPWYLGLFALGMAGAVIGFSTEPHVLHWRGRIAWGTLCTALCAFCIGVGILFASQPGWGTGKLWIVFDPLIGVTTTCLLVYCSSCLGGTGVTAPPVVRFLQSRWTVALGRWSYSLYLTHILVISLVHQFLIHMGLAATQRLLLLLVAGVPLSLLFAYIFFLVFEQPFMTGQPRRREVAGYRLN